MRPPPRFLYVQTNKRCNLRCNHCDFWKLKDDDRHLYLSRERRRGLLREFKELGGQTVVTCGGEPMLDIDDYFDLTSTARGLGLKMFSVVNGTRVHNRGRALRMMEDGPTEVTVSLDSHDAAEHDRMRGVRGSWAVAVSALRLLLAARAELGAPVRVYAMTIVCESNYRELDRFYDFVLNDVGADSLKLNIMQPTFGHGPGEVDQFFAAEQVKNPDDLLQVVDACDVKYQLGVNPAWRAQVAMYFRSIAKAGTALRGWSSRRGTEDAICDSYDRNIMVDVYGEARLCFSTAYPGRKLAGGDLADFWHTWSAPVRERMVGCKSYCGISHSVRHEPATLVALRRPRLVSSL